MVYKQDGGHGDAARCPLLHEVRLSKRSIVKAEQILFQGISCHGKNVVFHLHDSASCLPRLLQAVEFCCDRHSRTTVLHGGPPFTWVMGSRPLRNFLRLGIGKDPCVLRVHVSSLLFCTVCGGCPRFHPCIWYLPWHQCTLQHGVYRFPIQASRVFHHSRLCGCGWCSIHSLAAAPWHAHRILLRSIPISLLRFPFRSGLPFGFERGFIFRFKNAFRKGKRTSTGGGGGASTSISR